MKPTMRLLGSMSRWLVVGRCYNLPMSRLVPRLSHLAALLLLIGVSSAGCAKDIYQQRADIIKGHTQAFYRSLEQGRVAAAVSENEQIEWLARDMEQGLVKRASSMDSNQRVREWSLIKAANQTAIDNWLNLGRYLAATKRYDQAKGTYQRVIDIYGEKGPEYRSWVDRARLAVKDVDLILAPSHPDQKIE